MSTIEWTDADKAAYMVFAEEVRSLRDYVRRAGMMRVEVPTSEVRNRLETAFDRLGAR